MAIEKLYHWTHKKHIQSILKHGLSLKHISRKSQFIYLTKFPNEWEELHGKEDQVLLEVIVPKDIRLSCFEEYKDGTEILCWGSIPVKNLKVIN